MFAQNFVYAYSYINQNKISYRFHSKRVFLVTAWMRSISYQVVSQEFSENFPEKNIPNKITICKTVKKYREEGTKRM